MLKSVRRVQIQKNHSHLGNIKIHAKEITNQQNQRTGDGTKIRRPRLGARMRPSWEMVEGIKYSDGRCGDKMFYMQNIITINHIKIIKNKFTSKK